MRRSFSASNCVRNQSTETSRCESFMRTGNFHRYLKTRTLRGLAQEEWAKLATLWWFFLGPVLPLSLLALPRVVRDRRMKLLLITAIVTLAGLAVEAWHQPHYFAPMTCVIYAIVIQGLRHLRQWRRNGTKLGRALVPIVGIVCLAVCLFNIRAEYLGVPRNPDTYPWHWQRAEILERLGMQAASISSLFATVPVTIRFTNGSTTGLTLMLPRSSGRKIWGIKIRN